MNDATLLPVPTATNSHYSVGDTLDWVSKWGR